MLEVVRSIRESNLGDFLRFVACRTCRSNFEPRSISIKPPPRGELEITHSHSVKSVLRGLHYQVPPKAQGKLVHVVAGEGVDVAVDLRKSPPAFGQWVGEMLSAENKRQLWVRKVSRTGFS